MTTTDLPPVESSSPEPRPSITHQSVWAVSTQGAIFLCGIATSILVNRVLQPDGRGQSALIMLWPPVLASLGAAGWANSISWHASRASREAVRGIWSAALLAGSVLSLVLMAAGWGLIPLLLPGRREIWDSARAYLPFIPLAVLQMVSASALEGLGRFDRCALLRLGNPLLLLACMVPLAWAGRLDPVTYAAASLIPVGATALLGVSLVRRHTAGSWRPRASGLAPYALRAAPLVWAGIVNVRIDQILLVGLLRLPERDFGLYVASTAVAGAILPAAAGLSQVLIPAGAGRSGGETADLVMRMARLFVLFSAALALPVALLAPQVLALAFGATFVPGAAFLRAALGVAIVSGLLTMELAALQGLGRPGAASVVCLVSAAASTGLAVPALLAFGPLGALAAQGAGSLLGLALVRHVVRDAGWSWSGIVPRAGDIRGILDRLRPRVTSSQDREGIP